MALGIPYAYVKTKATRRKGEEKQNGKIIRLQVLLHLPNESNL